MGNKRKLIQSTLRSQTEYRSLLRALRNRHRLPIPFNPDTYYKKWQEWRNWGDWLGTGRCWGSGFFPFEEAREFVRKLNLKSMREWQKWRKHNRPLNIPSHPDQYYKEWQDWGDWLGTWKHQGGFLSFEEARKFVRKLNFKSVSEWRKWCKHRPPNIPYSPEIYYKEWKDWGDWLGTGKCWSAREFLPYEEARKFVRKLNLKSWIEWRSYWRKHRPSTIPCSPNVHYKEWKDLEDWLGYKLKLLPFEEARKFVRKLKLKSVNEWHKWCKHGRPSNMPRSPEAYYKEWQNWGDWLGTGRHNGGFLPFEEARKFVQKLKLKSVSEYRCKHNRPSNIPSHPDQYYKEWENWGDWLGTGRVRRVNNAKIKN